MITLPLKTKRLIRIIANSILLAFSIAGPLWYYIFLFNSGLVNNPVSHAYFTVWSNIVMIISSATSLVFNIKVYRNPDYKVPVIVCGFKFSSTNAVFLTFLTTVVYLAPTVSNPVEVLFTDYNIFMHLVTPITAILIFVLLEHEIKYPWWGSFTGLIQVIIYGTHYMIRVLIFHQYKYDVYTFVSSYNQVSQTYDVHLERAPLAIFIMLTGAYLL